MGFAFLENKIFKIMIKLAIESLLFGFLVGIIFFAIAPLALGIAFVEFLRPILIPGIDLLKLFWPWQSSGNIPASQWTLSIALNGFIYSILFFAILLARKNIADRKRKLFTIIVVILIFLLITGMLTNLYSYFISPNKSWILNVGA